MRISLAACLLGLWAGVAAAEVDLDKLHTPRSYLRYLPQLFDGANLMQASEQCATFLSGKIKLDDSTLDHPRFVYTCRNGEGQTYRWQVDGLSLAIIDDTRPEGRISFQQLQAEIDAKREAERQRQAKRQAEIDALQAERERIEQARQAEQRRREEEKERQREVLRRERIWAQCQKNLSSQTRNMAEREWLTRQQPEATAPDDETLRFAIDFNAVNPHGAVLEYRAYCRFAHEGETVTVEILPRAIARAQQARASSQSSAAIGSSSVGASSSASSSP